MVRAAAAAAGGGAGGVAGHSVVSVSKLDSTVASLGGDVSSASLRLSQRQPRRREDSVGKSKSVSDAASAAAPPPAPPITLPAAASPSTPAAADADQENQSCLGIPAAALAHFARSLSTSTSVQVGSVNLMLFPLPLQPRRASSKQPRAAKKKVKRTGRGAPKPGSESSSHPIPGSTNKKGATGGVGSVTSSSVGFSIGSYEDGEEEDDMFSLGQAPHQPRARPPPPGPTTIDDDEDGMLGRDDGAESDGGGGGGGEDESLSAADRLQGRAVLFVCTDRSDTDIGSMMTFIQCYVNVLIREEALDRYLSKELQHLRTLVVGSAAAAAAGGGGARSGSSTHHHHHHNDPSPHRGSRPRKFSRSSTTTVTAPTAATPSGSSVTPASAAVRRGASPSVGGGGRQVRSVAHHRLANSSSHDAMAGETSCGSSSSSIAGGMVGFGGYEDDEGTSPTTTTSAGFSLVTNPLLHGSQSHQVDGAPSGGRFATSIAAAGHSSSSSPARSSVGGSLPTELVKLCQILDHWAVHLRPLSPQALFLRMYLEDREYNNNSNLHAAISTTNHTTGDGLAAALVSRMPRHLLIHRAIRLPVSLLTGVVPSSSPGGGGGGGVGSSPYHYAHHHHPFTPSDLAAHVQMSCRAMEEGSPLEKEYDATSVGGCHGLLTLQDVKTAFLSLRRPRTLGALHHRLRAHVWQQLAVAHHHHFHHHTHHHSQPGGIVGVLGSDAAGPSADVVMEHAAISECVAAEVLHFLRACGVLTVQAVLRLTFTHGQPIPRSVVRHQTAKQIEHLKSLVASAGGADTSTTTAPTTGKGTTVSASPKKRKKAAASSAALIAPSPLVTVLTMTMAAHHTHHSPLSHRANGGHPTTASAAGGGHASTSSVAAPFESVSKASSVTGESFIREQRSFTYSNGFSPGAGVGTGMGGGVDEDAAGSISVCSAQQLPAITLGGGGHPHPLCHSGHTAAPSVFHSPRPSVVESSLDSFLTADRCHHHTTNSNNTTAAASTSSHPLLLTTSHHSHHSHHHSHSHSPTVAGGSSAPSPSSQCHPPLPLPLQQPSHPELPLSAVRLTVYCVWGPSCSICSGIHTAALATSRRRLLGGMELYFPTLDDELETSNNNNNNSSYKGRSGKNQRSSPPLTPVSHTSTSPSRSTTTLPAQYPHHSLAQQQQHHQLLHQPSSSYGTPPFSSSPAAEEEDDDDYFYRGGGGGGSGGVPWFLKPKMFVGHEASEILSPVHGGSGNGFSTSSFSTSSLLRVYEWWYRKMRWKMKEQQQQQVCGTVVPGGGIGAGVSVTKVPSKGSNTLHGEYGSFTTTATAGDHQESSPAAGSAGTFSPSSHPNLFSASYPRVYNSVKPKQRHEWERGGLLTPDRIPEEAKDYLRRVAPTVSARLKLSTQYSQHLLHLAHPPSSATAHPTPAPPLVTTAPVLPSPPSSVVASTTLPSTATQQREQSPASLPAVASVASLPPPSASSLDGCASAAAAAGGVRSVSMASHPSDNGAAGAPGGSTSQPLTVGVLQHGLAAAAAASGALPTEQSVIRDYLLSGDAVAEAPVEGGDKGEKGDVGAASTPPQSPLLQSASSPPLLQTAQSYSSGADVGSGNGKVLLRDQSSQLHHLHSAAGATSSSSLPLQRHHQHSSSHHQQQAGPSSLTSSPPTASSLPTQTMMMSSQRGYVRRRITDRRAYNFSLSLITQVVDGDQPPQFRMDGGPGGNGYTANSVLQRYQSSTSLMLHHHHPPPHPHSHHPTHHTLTGSSTTLSGVVAAAGGMGGSASPLLSEYSHSPSFGISQLTTSLDETGPLLPSAHTLSPFPITERALHEFPSSPLSGDLAAGVTSGASHPNAGAATPTAAAVAMSSSSTLPLEVLLQFVFHHLVVFLWAGKGGPSSPLAAAAAAGCGNLHGSCNYGRRPPPSLPSFLQPSRSAAEGAGSAASAAAVRGGMDVQAVQRKVERNLRPLPILIFHLYTVQRWSKVGWTSSALYQIYREQKKKQEQQHYGSPHRHHAMAAAAASCTGLPHAINAQHYTIAQLPDPAGYRSTTPSTTTTATTTMTSHATLVEQAVGSGASNFPTLSLLDAQLLEVYEVYVQLGLVPLLAPYAGRVMGVLLHRDGAIPGWGSVGRGTANAGGTTPPAMVPSADLLLHAVVNEFTDLFLVGA